MTEWNEPPAGGDPAGTPAPPTSPWAPGYGQQQPSSGEQPAYGQQAPAYGQQPPSFGEQPVYGEQSGAYPYATPSYQQPTPPQAPELSVEADPYAVPARKSKVPYLVAAAVTVVALVAGGLVWANARGWFTASGAASPNAAVQGLFDAVAKDDLVGVMKHIAPSEASLASDISGDVIDQLKRLEILKPDVSTGDLFSLDIAVSGLQLDPAPVTINDHVQVVRVTAGTITVDSKSAESVLTQKIQDATTEWSKNIPQLGDAVLQLEPTDGTHETFDIAKQMDATGGALRIATILDDGRWYASVAYTVADNAAYTMLGPDYPAQLQPLAATGAATPELAMDGLLKAIFSGDVRTMAATLDPGTLGAVQDYASAIFGGGSACVAGGGDDSAGACEPLDAAVVNADWSTTKVTGGQRVTVGSLTVKTSNGDVTIVRDASVPSLTITVPGEDPLVISPANADDFVRDMGSLFGMDPGAADPQVTAIIQRELTELLQWGVTMVQGADGQWYVSPIHTFSDLFLALLRGLEPGDIDYFLAHGN